MIKVNKLYKEYNNRIVIKDFNYDFLPGNIYVIMGESGVGKSTLLKAIGGIIVTTGGEIYYNEQKLAKPFHKKNRNLYRDQIGFVFQDSLLIEDLSIEKNIKEIGNFELSEDNFQQLNLDKVPGDVISTLSGGQKQRVAIMRAIIKNPKYLFCDEITANLDEENGQLIIDLIKQFKSKERIIIIVTHDHRFLEIADEVIKLK